MKASRAIYLKPMKRSFLGGALLLAGSLLFCSGAEPAAATQGLESPKGLGFAAPEEALSALRQAVEAKDENQMRAIFGPDVADLVNPDPVQENGEFEIVAKAMGEHTRLIQQEQDRRILEYGTDNTLFPVPLVKNEGRWYFDTAAGKEEVINRRIGRNELQALDSIRTYVQAQREYASADRDGDEVLEYAQKFASAPGKKDGLYWKPELDGTISPLGPLVAEAETAGYTKDKTVERQPFRGYYFKILTRQGKHAPGGAYDYIINGNMIGGFALVAWPAEYDVTGVMTFIVNQQGKVFQKDFGEKTARLAEAITIYDPDSTWAPSPD
jgi:hypothetical protein